RDSKVSLDGSDRSADVGRDQVQHFLCDRPEARDAQVVLEDDSGRLNAAEQVDQIVVDLAQFQIPVLRFFVDRSELFVGRLNLFFGCFQLFVNTLQFFVGRLHLFVRRLQLLVRRLLLLDYGLQVLSA